MSISSPFPDIFDDLKAQVQDEKLLDPAPIRGLIDMAVILVLFGALILTAGEWNLFLVGVLLSLVLARAYYLSHNILHDQYFDDTKLNVRLSYIFWVIMLGSSYSWWEDYHNATHHNSPNVIDKDEQIDILDGTFTGHIGNNPFIHKYRRVIFWASTLSTSMLNIISSYAYVIRNNLWEELVIMMLHWVFFWGILLYQLGLGDAMLLMMEVTVLLSIWISAGHIANHLGGEVFTEKEASRLTWMELQMRATRSLRGNFLTHWFYGGFDTHVEHHLFPAAPVYNLKKIQQITRDFTTKHKIPYNETSPIEAYLLIDNILKGKK